MFKVNNKDNIFTPFTRVSITEFEWINIFWIQNKIGKE